MSFGIFTRAKILSSSFAAFSDTPSDVDKFEINGKGCPGSTDKGVKIGKTAYLWASNHQNGLF